MKQHRTRQRHSTNRNHTPSVICLPPPSPPVTPKRATSALTLPKADEPLALSRQVRRQQRRAHTKTGIEPVVSIAPAPVAVAEPVAPLAPAIPVTSSVPIDADAPLPRNRSLAPTHKGLVAMLIGWLRKSAWRAPKHRETTAISQLQALRDEVAALQISLDRALEGLAA
jgi:hypothetical protein